MELIIFAKLFRDMTVEQMGEAALDLGVDGLDLAVRPEHYPVTPENMTSTLGPAVEKWRKMGLSVPMVTYGMDFVDPDDPATGDVLQTLADCGVKFMKLGYWRWKPGQDYWAELDAHRAALEKYAALGEKFGLCLLVHQHSRGFYCCNAVDMMLHLKGFDRKVIAAYLDPAHIRIDGDHMPMALEFLKGEYPVIAVTNSTYRLADEDGHKFYTLSFLPLEEGLVDWPETMKLIRASGFDGIVNYHWEVSRIPKDQFNATQKRDIAFVRKIWDEAKP